MIIGAKLLRIRFNKIDEFIRAYDTTRYLQSNLLKQPPL